MIEIVVLVVSVVGAGYFAAKESYARGRREGVREAVAEIAEGVRANYRKSGKPVSRQLDAVIRSARASFARAAGAGAGGKVVTLQLRRLGYEIAAAPEVDAQEERRKTGHLQVELTLRELLTVRWLAHAGFKLMMRNKDGDKFTFRDEKDAQESTFAIDRLEWSIPDENKDPKAPYALGLCRQKMIWERWPSGSALQHDVQNAA